MAFTYSESIAATRTRLDLLWMQIRAMLVRAARIGTSSTSLSAIESGVRKRWIEHINIYGMNSNNLCRAELYARIDWEAYLLQVAAGHDSLQIDSAIWEEDVAAETASAISVFTRFVQELHLRTEWTVSYSADVYADPNKLQMVRGQLGFVSAPAKIWAGRPYNRTLKVAELEEFTVGLRLSEE